MDEIRTLAILSLAGMIVWIYLVISLAIWVANYLHITGVAYWSFIIISATMLLKIQWGGKNEHI